MGTRMGSHAAPRPNHLSCCRTRPDKKITRTNQKAMGLYSGCSRGNLPRLGFIASLSPVMMLGLWAALVCRAQAPQPTSIWLWGGSWYWPDCTETSLNRLNLSLHCRHTGTYTENMHAHTHTHTHKMGYVDKKKKKHLIHKMNRYFYHMLYSICIQAHTRICET